MKHKMDTSEKSAYKYLESIGFKKVEYEPEGVSKPPDFGIGDHAIAIEVRRLNKNEAPSKSTAKPRGLEEISIPVRKDILRLLSSLGPPTEHASWYVHLKYRRPVPSRKEIEIAVRQHLKAFQDGHIQNDPTTIKPFNNFTLKLFCAGRRYSTYFVPLLPNVWVKNRCFSHESLADQGIYGS
jgi:hypothetical protein